MRKLPFYNLLRTVDALVLVADATAEPEVEVTIVLEELAKWKIFSQIDAGNELLIGSVLKKVLVVLNQIVATDASVAAGRVRKAMPESIRVVAVSAKERVGLNKHEDELYRVADIISVCTQAPGKKADLAAAFVLRAGSTVMDIARKIHRDFAEGLRLSQIWGSGKFGGQPMERDHVLLDGDIIELHI